MSTQEKAKELWDKFDTETALGLGKGGGVADGDFIRYECPNCKLKFWVELPN